MRHGFPNLGELLRHLRQHAGLSMRDVRLSLDVDIPRSTLYHWESRHGRPDPVDLGRMLALYGASEKMELLAYRLRAAQKHSLDHDSDGVRTGVSL